MLVPPFPSLALSLPVLGLPEPQGWAGGDQAREAHDSVCGSSPRLGFVSTTLALSKRKKCCWNLCLKDRWTASRKARINEQINGEWVAECLQRERP